MQIHEKKPESSHPTSNRGYFQERIVRGIFTFLYCLNFELREHSCITCINFKIVFKKFLVVFLNSKNIFMYYLYNFIKYTEKKILILRIFLNSEDKEKKIPEDPKGIFSSKGKENQANYYSCMRWKKRHFQICKYSESVLPTHSEYYSKKDSR